MCIIFLSRFNSKRWSALKPSMTVSPSCKGQPAPTPRRKVYIILFSVRSGGNFLLLADGFGGSAGLSGKVPRLLTATLFRDRGTTWR